MTRGAVGRLGGGRVSRWTSERRNGGVYAIQRAVGAKHGCAFFDLRAVRGGPESIRLRRRQGPATQDHVHLTQRGYAMLGEALLNAILAATSGADRPQKKEGAAERNQRPPLNSPAYAPPGPSRGDLLMFSLRTLCVIAAAFTTIACDEAPSKAEIELAPRVAELSPAEADAFCNDLEAVLVPAGERFACALETTLLTLDEGTCERRLAACEPEPPEEMCPYRDAAVRSACPATVEAVEACFQALRSGFEAAAEALSCTVAGDRDAKKAAFEGLEGLLAKPAACAALPAECLPQRDEEEVQPPVAEEHIEVPEETEGPDETEVPEETDDFPSETYGTGDWGVTLTAETDVAVCAFQVVCPLASAVVSFGGELESDGEASWRLMGGENVCSGGGRAPRVPAGGRISAWVEGRAEGCEVVIEAEGRYRMHRCDPSATEEACTAGEPVLVAEGPASLRL